MAIANYQLGFSATDREGEINTLPIEGTIPQWLRGSLIRTGPGTFEVGKQSYHHWFDGLAMLRKFSFEDGRVSFTNRFLASQAYQEAKAKGKISRSEFGTTARHSLMERLSDPLPRLTDNATVNVTMQGDRFIAVTESPMPIVFDPKTLNTIDRFNYHDCVPGQITTAHPHFDFQENAVYSYLVNLIPRCSYSIYRVESREAIMPRPSPLDPYVRLSPHTAPDVLTFRFCSCGYNRDSFREGLEGCFFSNWSGCHHDDANVPSRH